MSIAIIDNFSVKKKAPIDDRFKVADEAARLLIKWVYKGLRTFQVDNETWYKYIGNETTNLVSDWTEFEGQQGPAGPTGAAGVDGDPGDIYETSSSQSKTIPTVH